VSSGNDWRPRSELSFRALADLLPLEERPALIPEEINRVWLDSLWESRDGMSQARWGLTDYIWPDNNHPESLVVALSKRYSTLCFITVWEDPDVFEAASALIWRGRVQRRTLREVEGDRIRKIIYARHGLSTDDDAENPDESTANDDLDVALLDCVQRHWDTSLERLLRGLTPRR